MPTVSAQLWGIVVELDHAETQAVAKALDLDLIGEIGRRFLESLGDVGKAVLKGAQGVEVTVLLGYVELERALILNADKGCGVYLTLLWPYTWPLLGPGYLLWIPTSRPCHTNERDDVIAAQARAAGQMRRRAATAGNVAALLV